MKAIEAQTNHDVKAVEYFLREKLAGNREVMKVAEFIHFACTSEDINNLAHALMLKRARDRILLPALDTGDREAARELAHDLADCAMLARTHGQPASPTTMGKEIANVAHRLVRARERIAGVELTGKINGAVGNYNAHLAAYPGVDWEKLARGLRRSAWAWSSIPTPPRSSRTTAIAELFDAFARANTVLIDLDRDALGLHLARLLQAEGQGGRGRLLHHAAQGEPDRLRELRGQPRRRQRAAAAPRAKSCRSRAGSATSPTPPCCATWAWRSATRCSATTRACKGLDKLEADRGRMAADLDANWEVLAEPIQTVMRRYGIADAYEKLKELTRGKDGITRDALHAFIKGLAIPDAEKQRLLALTPATYIGKAAELAKRI